MESGLFRADHSERIIVLVMSMIITEVSVMDSVSFYLRNETEETI